MRLEFLTALIMPCWKQTVCSCKISRLSYLVSQRCHIHLHHSTLQLKRVRAAHSLAVSVQYQTTAWCMLGCRCAAAQLPDKGNIEPYWINVICRQFILCDTTCDTTTFDWMSFSSFSLAQVGTRYCEDVSIIFCSQTELHNLKSIKM